MVIKDFDTATLKSLTTRLATPEEVAQRLHDVLKDTRGVFAFNGLRLKMAQGDDAPMSIDHLVLHQYGLVLIKSVSIKNRISIDKKQQWYKQVNGKNQAMPSALAQAQGQAQALKDYLSEHASSFLEEGNSIKHLPIDVLVVFAEDAHVIFAGKRPEGLCFSYEIAQELRALVKHYKKALIGIFSSLTGRARFSFSSNEAKNIINFLHKYHVRDRSSLN